MTVPFDLRLGDCLPILRALPSASIDAVVTDPPYGLSFMGARWDYDVPGVEIWAECLRVLKPGGHLLAFAGTRTQHRMAVRIEDAGFEIRDMIAWVYGSGFPKSLDVSRDSDRRAGVDMEAYTGPVTDAARQWRGWGTALKPALEPITVARKPLIGTVAENVQQHGTGALNIDECRAETADNLNGGAYAAKGGRAESQSLHGGSGMNQPGKTTGRDYVQPAGRWPANLIHDGSDEVLAAFPEAPGQLADASRNAEARETQNCYGTMRRGRGDEPSADSENNGAVGFKMRPGARRLDEGSAARFFYCAKASKRDRGDGNNHPTVKPTDLMAYLCRLVTPAGGVVLDPFMGSGSTGKAAIREGFHFLGIEREAEHWAIAAARIGAEFAK